MLSGASYIKFLRSRNLIYFLNYCDGNNEFPLPKFGYD